MSVSETATVRWTRLRTHRAESSHTVADDDPIPQGRSFHSLSPLNPNATDRKNSAALTSALLLYGGRSEHDVFSDAWLFIPALSSTTTTTTTDSGSWHGPIHPPRTEQRNTPPPRAYHSAVVCNGGGSVYIFGGKNRDTLAGTWAFLSDMLRIDVDLASSTASTPKLIFTPVEQVNAFPRCYHSSTLIPGTNTIASYGGFDGHHFLDVLSLFDIQAGIWRHSLSLSSSRPLSISPTPPPVPEQGDCEDGCVFCGKGRRSVSHHPEASSTSSERRGNSTTARCDFCDRCALCGARTSCVHLSSHLSNLLKQKRVFSSKLRQHSADQPPTSIGTSSAPPRDAAQLLALPTTQSDKGPALYVTGGEVCGAFFDTILELKTSGESDDTTKEESFVWRSISGSTSSPPRDDNEDSHPSTQDTSDVRHQPPPCAYHCSWPVHNRSIAQFGGFAKGLNGAPNSFFNNVWLFDPRSGVWKKADQESEDVPEPRASAAVAAAGESSSYLFGGDVDDVYFNDLWRCDVSVHPTGHFSHSLKSLAACWIAASSPDQTEQSNLDQV